MLQRGRWVSVLGRHVVARARVQQYPVSGDWLPLDQKQAGARGENPKMDSQREQPRTAGMNAILRCCGCSQCVVKRDVPHA